jgi:hypothetical protein
MPLSLRQGLSMEEADGLRRLYQRVAQVITSEVPDRSFEDLSRFLLGVDASLRPAGQDDVIANRRDVARRLRAGLSREHRWRSLERLAVEAAVTEEEAADVLRAQDDIRFSKGKTGGVIVGLVSRVGPAR